MKDQIRAQESKSSLVPNYDDVVVMSNYDVVCEDTQMKVKGHVNPPGTKEEYNILVHRHTSESTTTPVVESYSKLSDAR